MVGFINKPNSRTKPVNEIALTLEAKLVLFSAEKNISITPLVSITQSASLSLTRELESGKKGVLTE